MSDQMTVRFAKYDAHENQATPIHRAALELTAAQLEDLRKRWGLSADARIFVTVSAARVLVDRDESRLGLRVERARVNGVQFARRRKEGDTYMAQFTENQFPTIRDLPSTGLVPTQARWNDAGVLFVEFPVSTVAPRQLGTTRRARPSSSPRATAKAASAGEPTVPVSVQIGTTLYELEVPATKAIELVTLYRRVAQ